MARLQAPGMVLILWQGLCMAIGAAEFIYDRPAPVGAVLALSLVTYFVARRRGPRDAPATRTGPARQDGPR